MQVQFWFSVIKVKVFNASAAYVAWSPLDRKNHYRASRNGVTKYFITWIGRVQVQKKYVFVVYIHSRDRPRFFDQVRHQATNASIENKHFFTK